jgi:hypothetical protein
MAMTATDDHGTLPGHAERGMIGQVVLLRR